MARAIDYLTFMVDVTPYEHEGNNYNALNIIVSYRKGQGFVCSWQPVLRTSMGYQTGPLPSRDPLVGGGGFVVKLASRNSVKVLEQMRTNLEVAKEGVKFYFDQRDFDALKNFMGDVANGGYPHDLETKIKNLINTTMATKNMTNNNESANVQQNAQVSNPANETPMSKQFKQLKEKNPGALLLFRCGDFYETYEDDAKVVSEVLGITLTKASNGTQMAGFPHHALDTYLPKIIRAGHRVAICDQLESEERRVKSEESATAAEPAEEDKAVTVPLGQHGTLVIGKPGIEKPQPAEEPVSEQPVEEPAPSAEEDVVDTTANDLPQVQFSTYKTKKGGTAPQIIGFGGEDDPRWKAHKDAGHKWVSASYRRDLNGNKVYILLFGTRYIDVAKALAGAYNTPDREAWHRAEDACTAIYEQAQRDGKARWEAKKAEWAAKKNEERRMKNEESAAAESAEKQVAAMLEKVMKGEEVPDSILKHINPEVLAKFTKAA